MSAVQPPEFDPLIGHHKYQRLRHLSGGACGFVVLALDKSSGDLVRPVSLSRPVHSKLTSKCSIAIMHLTIESEALSLTSLFAWSVSLNAGCCQAHREKCGQNYQECKLQIDSSCSRCSRDSGSVWKYFHSIDHIHSFCSCELRGED